MRRFRPGRRRRRLLAAALAVALPSLAVGSGLGISASAAPVAGLDWERCGEGLECANLPVPLDHARPAAGTIELAVVRIPARQPHRRIGSLVVLVGGPGQSGVSAVPALLRIFGPSLRDRFDIIGFDQRGVGGSAPVTCVPDLAEEELGLDGAAIAPRAKHEYAEHEYFDEEAAFDASVADAREWALECGRSSGAVLPYLSTEAAARDLDLLRAALGEERLTSYGASYGSVLGATYASLFPTRVRALVLDGAVDPNAWINHPFEYDALSARAFEAALSAFLADCAARPDCGFGDGDPAAAFERLLERLGEQPIPAGGKDIPGVMVDSIVALEAVLTALYRQADWPLLADALEEADERNDGSMLLSFLLGRAGGILPPFLAATDVSAGAYYAVTCIDQKDPPELAAYRRLYEQLDQQSPHFGAILAAGQLPCAFWPAQAASRYTGPFRADGAPPILVVGTTGDPAAPYPGAVSLAHQLGVGVLLTWRSFTHNAYPHEDPCIDRAVDRYLVDLTPPEPGTVCG